MISQVMRNIIGVVSFLIFQALFGFLLTPQNDVLSNNKAYEIVYL